MLGKLMLIDQSYDLETRVAIVEGPYLEDFDCEFSQNKLKKGNIYVGKVSRVEASLQAAFIDYGDDKNGFLAFSEIHPCYYQKSACKSTSKSKVQDVLPVMAPVAKENEDNKKNNFRIQDVLKKNQLVLVQITKDVRGSKGAALTTYISLPGKYCILMPGVSKESGISRKITDAKERENLKKIVEALKMPDDLSLIIRTAGLGKTKQEVKRDADYLMRLWSEIQKKTESIQTPTLIYEESDLVTRALRDLYRADIEEILIQGEEAYKKAKLFMRMLMPSHAKRIHFYDNPQQKLFDSFGIEDQIHAIYSNTVSLPSGGSIVINPTEALVAIDVNSAKSTKEKNIEDTALKTNLEAAKSIARQIKLRDLSGLIVIDFIDLHESKHVQIEKTLKEALKSDRARIQTGKISRFGLMEISRERLRQSILESSSLSCPYCLGKGRVLSLYALSLTCLHKIEKAAQDTQGIITVYGAPDVISYLLNEKRLLLCEIEKKFQVTLILKEDQKLHVEDFLIIKQPLLPSLPIIHTVEAAPPSIEEPIALPQAEALSKKSKKPKKKNENPVVEAKDVKDFTKELEKHLEKMDALEEIPQDVEKKKKKRHRRKKAMPQNQKEEILENPEKVALENQILPPEEPKKVVKKPIRRRKKTSQKNENAAMDESKLDSRKATQEDADLKKEDKVSKETADVLLLGEEKITLIPEEDQALKTKRGIFRNKRKWRKK